MIPIYEAHKGYDAVNKELIIGWHILMNNEHNCYINGFLVKFILWQGTDNGTYKNELYYQCIK